MCDGQGRGGPRRDDATLSGSPGLGRDSGSFRQGTPPRDQPQFRKGTMDTDGMPCFGTARLVHGVAVLAARGDAVSSLDPCVSICASSPTSMRAAVRFILAWDGWMGYLWDGERFIAVRHVRIALSSIRHRVTPSWTAIWANRPFCAKVSRLDCESLGCGVPFIGPCSLGWFPKGRDYANATDVVSTTQNRPPYSVHRITRYNSTAPLPKPFLISLCRCPLEGFFAS
ncbi:hypothetical protein F5144DRAFT_79512 [Chaetomium tenue]|uniref:Uncharacterized protein n=1 Tax=Chaetomium tenue TaxID=1854479 RepID=A0ACB7PT24_9PEZI|nr:hypothetical protein F5144DRAFT_79512 [Chaetomium globosum]